MLGAALGCASALPATPVRGTDGPIIIDEQTASGARIELRVSPVYRGTDAVRIEVRMRAGTVALRGPLAAGIEFIGGAEGRSYHVRTFDVTTLDRSLMPHTSRVFTLTWDRRDDAGQPVLPDDYTVYLRAVDLAPGGRANPILVGATLQLR